MIVTKQQNGSYLITDIIGTQLVKQVYYGHTKKAAMKLFRQFKRYYKPR